MEPNWISKRPSCVSLTLSAFGALTGEAVDFIGDTELDGGAVEVTVDRLTPPFFGLPLAFFASFLAFLIAFFLLYSL